jgi:hypothetical protein
MAVEIVKKVICGPNRHQSDVLLEVQVVVRSHPIHNFMNI